MPVAANLVKPCYDTEADTQALVGTKQRQQYYYNRAAKPLKTITPGETVCMKLPGQDTWSPGTCTEKLENRSYMVKVGDTVYRRNRRHIQKTNEPPITVHPEPDQVLPTLPEDNLATPPDPSSEAPVTDPDLRRSSRNRRTPVWHEDYVMTKNKFAILPNEDMCSDSPTVGLYTKDSTIFLSIISLFVLFCKGKDVKRFPVRD